MNGRMYAVTFDGVTITNAGGDQDLLYIAPADDKICVVHAVAVSQSSDVADAAEEILRVKLIRGHSTVGSGGSAVTPTPLNPSDTAAGFTARRNDTTIASSGTGVDVWAEAFNIRVGMLWVPTPEMRPIVTQAQGSLVLRLMSTVADDVTGSASMIVEEIG